MMADYYYDELSLDLSSSYCPCPTPGSRFLQEDSNSTASGATTTDELVVWEVVFSSVVLFLMFVALVSDRVGADMVMITTLTAFMASRIITVEEGLVGFSNEGLLTVMVLFVVAEGISKTGALDWYMSKLLGRPQLAAAAQLRLMIPIATVSAFLNNVPIVLVMIPIVQKWSKNIKISVQQLLIPLSFASILGGTCTLIGTSTNLVVAGLLYEAYPNDPSVQIGLFDLGEYGVPIAMAGMTYILLLSPFLLPGGRARLAGSKSQQQASPLEQDDEGLLMGARLTSWSPAAGRSVKRSGLRDTGGIYLVSVQRATTGNVHRAVSGDFILNVGDILWFTGLIETFGEFCNEHVLEIITNEIEEERDEHSEGPNGAAEPSSLSNDYEDHYNNNSDHGQQDDGLLIATGNDDSEGESSHQPLQSIFAVGNHESLPTVNEHDDRIIDHGDIPKEIGCTKESLLEADEAERLRSITRMADIIHGFTSPSKQQAEAIKRTSGLSASSVKSKRALSSSFSSTKTSRRITSTEEPLQGADPANIVVAIEKDLVVVGMNCQDRPGLLLDISKGLLRLNLQLKHTEAAVVDSRSISIWRCEAVVADGGGDETIPIPDLEEIWVVLNALLSQDHGIEAMKQRGLRVIRARVRKESRLINKTATEIEFTKIYKAAIVAIQQSGGMNISHGLSQVRFNEGDVLILQARDDSALLKKPPDDFYRPQKGISSRENSVQSLVNLITRKRSNAALDAMESAGGDSVTAVRTIDNTSGDNIAAGTFFIPSGDMEMSDSGMSGDDALVMDEELVAPQQPPSSSNDENISSIITSQMGEEEAVWHDLQVMFTGNDNEGEDGDDNLAGHEQTLTREFLTAMQVAKNAKWAGKSAKQVGLQKLPDLFLVSIERPVPSRRGAMSERVEEQQQRQQDQRIVVHNNMDSILSLFGGESANNAGGSEILSKTSGEPRAFIAVEQHEPLQAGDILWFSGDASAVGDLRKIPGLKSYEDEEVKKMKEHVHDRRLVQAVIARKGPLVGKTVKETSFRTKYGAAVIAVHREGKRVHEHPGNVKLQAGDVLLLEAGPSFLAKTAQNDRSFALLAEVKDSAPPRLRLLIPALILAVLMLVVYVAGWMKLLVSALCASILMVAFGILSEQEARDAINWEVYIIIAAAFGIGTALVKSGVAGGIANLLVGIGTAVGLGGAGLYGAIYFATFLISNVVTNNAAAALVFPIAMDVAEQTNTDRILMSYALMLGASASFMTPFGYTTNLLIYGPGGYKYTDFLYFGFPMQLVLWVLTTAFLVLRPWYISWILTGAIFVFVVFVRLCSAPFYRALQNQRKLGKRMDGQHEC